MSQVTTQRALEIALTHHQAGRLGEAEKIYRQVLAAEPANMVALHRLGVLAAQSGHLQQGIDLLRRSIAIRPTAVALSNLGKFLVDSGQSDQAIECCRSALALQPTFADAYNNLGVAMRAKGDLPEAIAAYRKAIEQRPDYVIAYSNLSAALTAQREFDEAIAAARAAIAIDPAYVEARDNLCIALRENGQLEEALAECRETIRIKPGLAEAHNSLGNVLFRLHKHAEAIAAYQQAVRLKPDFAEAYNNLGAALRDRRRPEEAVAAFSKAVEIRPAYAMAFNNLGTTLKELGRFDEAERLLLEALRLKPDLPMAHNNLGNVYKELARIEEAIASYTRSAELGPHHPIAESNRLYTMYYDPRYDGEAILGEHLAWNQRAAAPLRKFILPHQNDRSMDRRVRIGYVSPNFWKHCQALFMQPLLSHHDRDRFEIFCYSEDFVVDEITERARGYTDGWREMGEKSDEQVAAMIREDRIDILVDLTLHMAQNRILLFARKPAPVQATWLGYPGTTGLAAMDFRLTDPYLDPPGEGDTLYAERSLRLSRTFWCYDPAALESSELPPAGPLPAATNGYVAFGCLNNFCKVNQALLELWKRVLDAVAGSRLLLLTPQGSARKWVRATLGDRVDFVDRQSRSEYLKVYHRIDIGLDTLPYNGHTTTLDSLWMGVPVVTLIGKTLVGRAGLSQLSNLGLTELAAKTEEHFVSIAAGLAEDLPKLAEMRRTLRARMEASPLMDAGGFAHDIETAYRRMWREWCQAQ